jgi:hypothetical protein
MADTLQKAALIPRGLPINGSPLGGPEIRKISWKRVQKLGGFTLDDDRLDAAASRAGIGPVVGVEGTSHIQHQKRNGAKTELCRH